MKLLQLILLAGAVALGTLTASAHPDGGSAKGSMPEHGFWVIVTNLNIPDSATIQFYDQKNVLLYEEHIAGFRFDTGKKRTRRRLNESLVIAMEAWNRDKETLKDKGIVSEKFRIGGKYH